MWDATPLLSGLTEVLSCGRSFEQRVRTPFVEPTKDFLATVLGLLEMTIVGEEGDCTPALLRRLAEKRGENHRPLRDHALFELTKEVAPVVGNRTVLDVPGRIVLDG